MSYPANLLRPEGYLDIKTDGVLTALVMVQLLLEPYPVNPFLVYAAFFDNDSCIDFLVRPYKDYKPEHLISMILDKEDRDLVFALLKLKPEDKIAFSHPLFERGVSIEIPASLFGRKRDDVEQDAIVRPLLCLLLVGHHEPWKRLQFEAF